MKKTTLLICTGAILACGGGGAPTAPPPPPPAALSVTAVTPPIAHPGDGGVSVTISGTGFSTGTTVAWTRNGVVEPKVRVVSVQVASSTSLSATLNIAQDAPVSYYDIAVSGNSATAALTGRFEVTEAYPIDGTTYGLGVNEAGAVVGRWDDRPDAAGRISAEAFLWTRTGGKVNLPGDRGNIDVNGAHAIDEAGATIVGVTGGNEAVVWTKPGTTWVRTGLPHDPASRYSLALALASDPQGQAFLIAGAELTGDEILGDQHAYSYAGIPIVWIGQGSTWQRVVLPMGSAAGGGAGAASASGRVAGSVAVGPIVNRTSVAAVWTRGSNGEWTLDILNGDVVSGINSAGDLAVGTYQNAPAYWKRTGAVWSQAIPLPPEAGCNGAVAVDDAGRILGNPCRPQSHRYAPVIWYPPYDRTSFRVFGGLLDPDMAGHPKALSIHGTWMAGFSFWGPNGVAAYWRGF